MTGVGSHARTERGVEAKMIVSAKKRAAKTQQLVMLFFDFIVEKNPFLFQAERIINIHMRSVKSLLAISSRCIDVFGCGRGLPLPGETELFQPGGYEEHEKAFGNLHPLPILQLHEVSAAGVASVLV